MIVLAYLLVIAVAVALWAAVSLRRVSASPVERRERPSTPQDANTSRNDRPASHDAYRGVRAQQRNAEASFADPYLADEPPARSESGVGVGVAGKAVAGPRGADRAGPDVRTDGIRVVESRRERDRKAETRAAERAPKDDAFERFLRANEELER